MRRYISSYLVFLMFIFAACSSGEGDFKEASTEKTAISVEAESAPDFIEEAIKNDDYKNALAVLERYPDLKNYKTLKEKTHLNYGLYLEYRGKGNMRDRMVGALRQFVQTLQINPDNTKANAEIKQIMSVYATFPNRQPPQGLVDTLRTMNLVPQN